MTTTYKTLVVRVELDSKTIVVPMSIIFQTNGKPGPEDLSKGAMDARITIVEHFRPQSRKVIAEPLIWVDECTSLARGIMVTS